MSNKKASELPQASRSHEEGFQAASIDCDTWWSPPQTTEEAKTRALSSLCVANGTRNLGGSVAYTILAIAFLENAIYADPRDEGLHNVLHDARKSLKKKTVRMPALQSTIAAKLDSVVVGALQVREASDMEILAVLTAQRGFFDFTPPTTEALYNATQTTKQTQAINSEVTKEAATNEGETPALTFSSKNEMQTAEQLLVSDGEEAEETIAMKEEAIAKEEEEALCGEVQATTSYDEEIAFLKQKLAAKKKEVTAWEKEIADLEQENTEAAAKEAAKEAAKRAQIWENRARAWDKRRAGWEKKMEKPKSKAELCLQKALVARNKSRAWKVKSSASKRDDSGPADGSGGS